MNLRIIALLTWVAFLFFIAYFLVHIDPGRSYGFGRAIGHGFLAVHNWLISWFDGREYWAPQNSGRGYFWGFYLGLCGLPLVMNFISRILEYFLTEWIRPRRSPFQ